MDAQNWDIEPLCQAQAVSQRGEDMYPGPHNQEWSPALSRYQNLALRGSSALSQPLWWLAPRDVQEEGKTLEGKEREVGRDVGPGKIGMRNKGRERRRQRKVTGLVLQTQRRRTGARDRTAVLQGMIQRVRIAPRGGSGAGCGVLR